MEGNFILEYYDVEENVRTVYQYWINNGRYYRRSVHGNSISRITRISEAAYISALEELHNA